MALPRKLKELILNIAPMSFWQSIRIEIHLFFVRLHRARLSRTFESIDGSLVNFGPGSSGLHKWVNVDAFPATNVNCVWDCRYPLPLPDNFARGVFSEHFLEHLDYDVEALNFLKECFRIMQPQSTIRIVVPDAGAFLNAYCAHGWKEMIKLRLTGDDHKDIGYEIAYKTKMQVVNVLFRQFGQHQYAYDFETLRELLIAAGFSNVSRCNFRESCMPELAIDKESRSRESLYVEATKV